MAQDKFQTLSGRVIFEFNAAKNRMIQRWGSGERVFTKESFMPRATP
jgi:hypothetical protein